MGHIRFLIPRPEFANPQETARAYMAGIDDIPWRTKVMLVKKDELLVERTENDSGYFYIPWKVAGFGHVTLSTATLIERPTAYHLPVELARGTLNRLRNQLSSWESVGLSPNPRIRQLLAQATQHFSRAVLSQGVDLLAATDDAQRALEIALETSSILSDDYIEQSVSSRRKSNHKIATLLGAAVDQSLLDDANVEMFSAAFDSASVHIPWHEVEREQGRYEWAVVDQQIAWCQARGLRVCAGPLIQLSKTSAPDWIALWDGDFENLLTFVTAYIQAAVHRYRGKVALWHCAAGLNVSEVLELTEEQQLRLAAYALQAFRRADPRAPVILSIDQPWAEYMSRRECDLSPLHFVDALCRADLGLAGVGLELNFGFSAQATLPRDWCEFSRQIDRWTALGLPLIVLPTLPDFRGEPQAEQIQSAWTQRFLGLMLSKPAVQAVLWQRWQDASLPGSDDQGGLVDLIGEPKKALRTCTHVREEFLGQ